MSDAKAARAACARCDTAADDLAAFFSLKRPYADDADPDALNDIAVRLEATLDELRALLPRVLVYETHGPLIRAREDV
jgi:hypothetical protein